MNNRTPNNHIKALHDTLLKVVAFMLFGVLLSPLSGFSQQQIFTSSGTFTVPAGVTEITVECWGGGGAGGGANKNKAVGGGGAGGGYARKVITVNSSQQYTVTVGAQAVGTTNTVVNGNPSWFGNVNTVYASGGGGGNPNNGAGGTSAALTTLKGDFTKQGGDGGTVQNENPQGGGGGGAAGPTGNGISAFGSTGGAGNTPGGNGANGVLDRNGLAGSIPGGGGSGAKANNGSVNWLGGNGAAGQVVITWKQPVFYIDPTSINFGYVPSGLYSSIQTYSLNAKDLEPLSGNIIISAPSNFEISTLPSNGFSSSITVEYLEGVLSSKTIYVRFRPTSINTDYSGNITHVGGGASKVVSVTGNSKQAQYCLPKFTTGTAEGDFISLVQLGSISNTTTASSGPNYYTFYDLMQTELERNKSYTVTIKSGTYPTANNISIWIDFNQSGTFEAIEKLGNVTLAGSSTGSITFTVPSNAIKGITRMRVRDVWDNVNIDPCLDYTYGETEDYNVNICVNQWTGNTSSQWNLLSNWSISIPDLLSDALIPTGRPNYPIITTSAACKDLVIETGASVTVNGSIQIGNNIQNSGTLNSTAGIIEMRGSSTQVIPAGTFSSNRINNLIINNTNGVTLNGTLEISGYLKVQLGDLQTNGYLTLLSTATSTALIDGSGAGNVLGTVTMQRYLPSAFGYKYFSSPFSNATVAEFADDIDLVASFPAMYRYEQNKVSTGWDKYITPASPLVPGAGYSLNFGTSKTPKTVSTKGVVNNGSITLTLFNHNQAYTKGFNLVGNPYPSPINWKSTTGWTKTNIDDAIYLFATGDTNQYYGTYSSFVNNVSSDGKASSIIASQQGFFVHVSNGTFPVQGSLTFTNQVRVNNLNPLFFKNSATGPTSYIRISARHEGSETADYMVVYFNDGMIEDFDPATDALKLMNTDPSVPNIYTQSRDDKDLSIDAINYPIDNTVSIPLVVNSGKKGTITLKATQVVELPHGYYLYLKDNQTGKIQDLQSSPEYRYDANEETLLERFSILLSKSKLSQEILGTKSFNAFIQDGTVYLNLSLKEEQVMVQVTDLMGRTILQTSVYGEGNHKLGLLKATGVYIVSLYTDMGIISKKIYLN